jgi:hypothetical protein
MTLRDVSAAAAVAASLVSAPNAQGIYREPFRDSRPVKVVVAEPPPPVELRMARASTNPLAPTLTLLAEARRVRGVVYPAGLTLRLAFTMNGGMTSVRLVTATTSPQAQALPHALPADWTPIPFNLAPGEPMPPLHASSAETPAVVTIERVVDANGTEVWANRNARELLWRGLGLGVSSSADVVIW